MNARRYARMRFHNRKRRLIRKAARIMTRRIAEAGPIYYTPEGLAKVQAIATETLIELGVRS